MREQNNKKFMPDIIGQKLAKKKLEFLVDGHAATGVMPHLMFVGMKGAGKTFIAESLKHHMKSKDDPSKNHKDFMTINCSTLKSLPQFANTLLIPHIHGKEITVLFDEASELPKDVEMALLTILNVTEQNTTQFSYEDYDMQFDFSRQNFMFATTEAQSVFHALMDRCERVDLEEYSYDDLAKIVAIKLRKVKFGKGVLEQIAPVLRGNARAAQKMAIHIRNYLKAANKKTFIKADWDKLCDHLGILPLGINPIELQLLRHLSERKECSLTYLAAKTGLTKPCLQRDYEVYLQKQNLMEISTAGRAITPKGKDYLEELGAGV